MPEVPLTLVQELAVFFAQEKLLQAKHSTVVVSAVARVQLESILL